MSEANPTHGADTAEPADDGPSAPDGAAPTAQWAAPTYDLHPPAESTPTGPDGPSHFGGTASAASNDADHTSVLPVVDDGSPLVWPELRGTPLIGRFAPVADDPGTGPARAAVPIARPASAALPIGPPASAAIPVAPPAPAASAPVAVDAAPVDAAPVAAVPVDAAPVAASAAPVAAVPIAAAAVASVPTPVATVDPPTEVISLVKAATEDKPPDEPASIEPGPSKPAPSEPATIATELTEPAPVDIEPIVAVLVPTETSAPEPMDSPTEVVDVIQADLLPEPASALIVALQAIPPAYPPQGQAPQGYGQQSFGQQGYAPLMIAPPASPAQSYAPPPPAPMWAPPAQRSRATQSVTCPECGTVVPVDPQARSSLDFCPNPVCDFPLFWVRPAVVADATSYGEGASHRRLPGTAGRAVAASMPCPHCTEPNPLSGVLCVRCGLDLRPIVVVAPPPPPPQPEPVYIAQEIDEPINWWLIILVGALIVLFFAALAFIAVAYLVD